MKQPVDFRPEKPRIDLPDTTLKPSVRLAGALTSPDGRTMLDPPTIDLGDIISPSHDEDAMNPPAARKSTNSRKLQLPPMIDDPPMVELPKKIIGTESLFRSDDLLDRLDQIVDEAEKFQGDLHLPEVPPLPDWQRKYEPEVESKCEPKVERENIMTPHVEFSVLDEFVEEILDEKETEILEPPFHEPEVSETLFEEPVIGFSERKHVPFPVVRPSRPTVFRSRIKPTKSLEVILPKVEVSPALSVSPVLLPEVSGFTPLVPTGRELLLTENLTKSYYKKKLKIPVLKGVNFFVNPGDFVSIIGQSGSGKSTLLHLLGTLDAPESGSIRFEGRRVDNLPAVRRDQLRNRSIGFIFQFYHLLPELSTLENVLSPLMIRESALGYFFKRKQYVEKAREILAQVGLSHRLKHKPCELSGGEMQRAAIARALISGPKILLADEPTGNLDSASAREIIELLRHLKEQRQLTIVMVTHDNLIAQAADRIVRMVDGVIVSSDSRVS